MDSQKHLSSAWQSPSLPARCTTTFRLMIFPKNHQCLQVLEFSKGTQGTSSGMPGPTLWLPGTTDALFWDSQSPETLLCCKSSKIFITARPKSSKSFPFVHRTEAVPIAHRTCRDTEGTGPRSCSISSKAHADTTGPGMHPIQGQSCSGHCGLYIIAR